MPSVFFASPSAFIESAWLPALCAASPSARSFFTLAASASLSFGLLASLASMAFISLGQLCASAKPAALANATLISSLFICAPGDEGGTVGARNGAGQGRQPAPSSALCGAPSDRSQLRHVSAC